MLEYLLLTLAPAISLQSQYFSVLFLLLRPKPQNLKILPHLHINGISPNLYKGYVFTALLTPIVRL